MKTVVNLLDANTSGFSEAGTPTGNWTVVQQATLQRSSARSNSGFASLLVTATGTSPIVESGSSGNLVVVTAGSAYRMVARFHHSIPGRIVNLGIQFFDAVGTRITQSSTDTVAKAMGYADWTLVTLETVAPANAATAALRVSMSSVDVSPNPLDPDYQSLLGDKYLWLDDLALIKQEPIIDALGFPARVKRWIPEHIIEDDSALTNPDNPLLRYVDLVGYQMDDIMELTANFDYLPVDEGGFPGETSALVDTSTYPERSRKEWVLWMQQVVGTTPVLLAGSGYTGWDYFSGFTDWSAWETSINAATLNYSQSYSAAARTSGTVTLTVPNTTGLKVGGVITVTGGTAGFRGTYEIASLTSTTIVYSQQFIIESATRSGTTVTVRTYRPHALSVGESVTISGTGVAAFNGSFTVTGIASYDDTVREFTYTTGSSGTAVAYTGTATPANGSGTGGTAATSTDLEWQYIEGQNPYPIDPYVSAAYQVRSGATGLWSGTREGLARTARISMSGRDQRGTFQMSDGAATVTFPTAHQYVVGDKVRIYDSPVPGMNMWHTISAVTSTSITVPGSRLRASGICWVTNKRIVVAQGWAHLPVYSITVSSGTMTVVLDTGLVATPETAISLRIYNSGSSAVDALGASNPVPVFSGSCTYTLPTTANPRLTIVVPSTGLANITLDSSTIGSNCTLLYKADRYSSLLLAPASQTVSSASMVELCAGSKPAGGVVSYKALPEAAFPVRKDVIGSVTDLVG